MNKPIHVKLETGEAIYSRKNLLSTEINFLNLIRGFQDYKKIRIQELKAKTRMGIYLRQLHTKIKELEKLLPEVRQKEVQKLEIKGRVMVEKSTSKKLENELREIKAKLSSLG